MSLRTVQTWLAILGLFMAQAVFAATITRNLVQGWNLVSIPVSSDTDVTTYLTNKGLSGKVAKIWVYDGGWAAHVPGAANTASGSFNTFKTNRGYWFNMNESATFSYDTAQASFAPVVLNTTGWTLLSFNLASPTSIGTSILATANIDSAHEANNVAKIWGYGDGWKFYSPANPSSSTTTTLNPGFGYWFNIQNFNGKNVSSTSNMTITPTGATGQATLVVGGATSLVPPTTNQVRRMKSRLANLAKYTTVSAPSTTFTTEQMACSSSNNGMEIGVATAYSLTGQPLATGPIVCNFSNGQIQPSTYAINFTSEQKQFVATNPDMMTNVVVSAQLNSGQEQKSLLGNEIKNAVANNSTEVTENVSSSSSLALAVLSQKMAEKMGIPADRLKLGEMNAGLPEVNAKILDIVKKDEIDPVKLSSQVEEASTNPASAYSKVLAKVENANSPAELGGTGTLAGKTDEITAILNGTSQDPDVKADASFSTQLQNAEKISDVTDALIAAKDEAVSEEGVSGILSTSDVAKLEAIIDALAANDGDVNLITAATVLSESLALTNATSDDELLGDLVQSNFNALLTTVAANVESLQNPDATTMVAGMVADALQYPNGVLALMGANPEAASAVAEMVGNAMELSERAEAESAASTEIADRSSDATEDLAKLEGASGILLTLAENAGSTEEVSEILAQAVAAAYESTAAEAGVFEQISVIKTALSTTDKQVDLVEVMENCVGQVDDLAATAEVIAANADNAGDAAKILGQASSALTTDQIGEILSNDKLKNEFALDSRVFADAGPDRRRQVDGATTDLVLDAANSFDPQGSVLTYAWTEVDPATGSTVGGVISTSAQPTISVTNLDGSETKAYQVVVTATDGRSSTANFNVEFYANVPPVIVAPDYLLTTVNEEVVIDAFGSFDPEGEGDLTYAYDFGQGFTSNSGNARFTFTTPGLKKGILTVSTASGATATKEIRISVKGQLPPVAGAGFDLVIKSGTKPRLDNFSYSLGRAGRENLEYSWEPKSYFSKDAGINASSERPQFISTAPGRYPITLTVKDTATGLKASDDVLIVVRGSNPPISNPGPNRVVRLGTTAQTLVLDGTKSFSFVTSTPEYSWTGPVSFSGTSSTSSQARVELTPSQFNDKTTLTFNLKVTDANGEAEKSVVITVIPSVRPPAVLIERSRQEFEYRAGSSLTLDASRSFSTSGGTLSYNWEVLSDVTVADGTGGTSSKIGLTLPLVNSRSEVKVRLTVTDSATGKTGIKEEVLVVVPVIQPPLALINFHEIVLGGKASGENDRVISLNGYETVNRTGNELTYSWSFDNSLITLSSGDLASGEITVAGASVTEDSDATVTLTVVDTVSGLSSSDTCQVRVLAPVSNVDKIDIDLNVKQEFDFATKRSKPFYDEVQGNFIYDAGSRIEVFGSAFDPNFSVSDLPALTATLFNYSSGSRGAALTSVSILGDADAFSLRSAELSGVETLVQLAVGATSTDDSGARNAERTMLFRVRPTTLRVQPVAKPVITFIDSRAAGRTIASTNDFTGSFADDRIFVQVSGATSTNPGGGRLKYSWELKWQGTLDEIKAAPTVFANGRDRAELSFELPLVKAYRKLRLQLTVTDELGGVAKATANADINVARQDSIPPLANAGEYPVFILPAGATAPTTLAVKLDGRKSLSPTGKLLNFTWKYAGIGSVFGGSGTATGVNPTAVLGEGEHPFELFVKDTDNQEARAFVVIKVEKARLAGLAAVTAGFNYIARGNADAFPIDATAGQTVLVKSEVFIDKATTSVANIDPSKVRKIVKLNDVQIGGVLTDPRASVGISGSNLTTPGQYKVEVVGWYNLHDGVGPQNTDTYDPILDQSTRFVRVFFINVREDIRPFPVELALAPVVSLGSGATSAPVNFQIKVNPNGAPNLSGGKQIVYRYEVRNQSQTVVASTTGSAATTLIFPVTTSALTAGQYFVNAEVNLRDANGRFLFNQPMRAGGSFVVESSDVILDVVVQDLKKNLDLSALSVTVAGVTTESSDDVVISTVTGSSLTVDSINARVSAVVNPLPKTAGNGNVFVGLKVTVTDGTVILIENLKQFPQRGRVKVEVVNRATEIDGKFIRPGEFFSFSRDNIYSSLRDKDGADLSSLISILVDSESRPVFTGTSYSFENAVFFTLADNRRITRVFPAVGETSEGYYNKALRADGGLVFNRSLFDFGFTGKIFPEQGAVFLVEFPRPDGGYNYALILVTYVDKFGFAFRYARAVKTSPDISFGGASVQDEVQLAVDPQNGALKAQGGVPRTPLKVLVTANAAYVIKSQGGTVSVTTELSRNRAISLGSFDSTGSLTGVVEFNDEFKPKAGDYIEILGYEFATLQGVIKALQLPQPIRIQFREDLGGFAFDWARVTADNQFEVKYVGDASAAIADVNNYLVGVGTSIQGPIFQNMNPGSNQIASIANDTANKLLTFNLNSNSFSSVDSFIAVSATPNVTATNGSRLGRGTLAVSRKPIFGAVNSMLTLASAGEVKYLEIQTGDASLSAPSYQRTDTTTVSADTASKVATAPVLIHRQMGDGSEFQAFNYDDGIRFLGQGNAFSDTPSINPAGYPDPSWYPDPTWMHNFYILPQGDDYDQFTNTGSARSHYLLTAGASVGALSVTTYRVGNTFGGGATFGQDYRALRTVRSRVVRILPVVQRAGYNFDRVAEVRTTIEEAYPKFNQDGQFDGFDTANSALITITYLIANRYGIIEERTTNQFRDFNGNLQPGYTSTRTVVGFKDGNVFHVGPGADVQKLDANKVFTNVRVRLDLGLRPELQNDVYRVLVFKPSSTSTTGFVTDSVAVTNIETSVNANRFSFFNPGTEFELNDVVAGNYTFRAYKLSNPSSTVVTAGDEVGFVSLPIDGKIAFQNISLPIRSANDLVFINLNRDNSFSFLAGNIIGNEDGRRDVSYVRTLSGATNSFGLVLNPGANPSTADSSRRVVKINVVGTDLKSRFESLYKNANLKISTSSLSSGLSSFVDLEPGQIYLYRGPGVNAARGAGDDRVIVAFAVVKEDDGGLGFVYLIKPYNGEAEVNFFGLTVNGDLGLELFSENFRATRMIEGFAELFFGSNKIDFNLSGDPMAKRAAHAANKTTPEVIVSVLSSGYSVSLTANSSVTSIVKLSFPVEVHGLGTALNPDLLSSSMTFAATQVFTTDSSFLATDLDGNHILLTVRRPMGNMVGATGTVAGGAAAFADFTYLMDGNSPAQRYMVQPAASGANTAGGTSTAVNVMLDSKQPVRHDVLLDFNLTGQQFQLITNAAGALLGAQLDRFSGDLFVQPEDPMQSALLNGTKVWANLVWGSDVNQISIDRFDGMMEVPVSKVLGEDELQLGTIRNGSLFAKLRIEQAANGALQSGYKVSINRLSWELPGNPTRLTTDVNLELEYNANGGNGGQPVDFNSFRVLGAKIGVDAARAFIELRFNKPVDPSAQDAFQYVKLVQKVAQNNTAATGANLPNPPMFKPISSIVVSPSNMVIRNFFSAADSMVVSNPMNWFHAELNSDFSGATPRGIKSADQEVLGGGFIPAVSFANIFAESPGFFNPVTGFNGDGYVFNISGFMNGQTQSGNQSVMLSSSVETDGNATWIQFTDGKKIVFRPLVNPGRLQFCGTEADYQSFPPSPSVLDTKCTTIWVRESTSTFGPASRIGEAFVYDNGATVVTLEDYLPEISIQGIRHTSAVAVTIERDVLGGPSPEHQTIRLVFARGIGLISYFVNRSSGFNFLGYEQREVSGVKLLNGLRLGNLGLFGLRPDKVGVEFDVLFKSGLNPLNSDGSYGIEFLQRSSTGSLRTLAYTTQATGGVATTSPLNIWKGTTGDMRSDRSTVYFTVSTSTGTGFRSGGLENAELVARLYGTVPLNVTTSYERHVQVPLNNSSFLWSPIDYTTDGSAIRLFVDSPFSFLAVGPRDEFRADLKVIKSGTDLKFQIADKFSNATRIRKVANGKTFNEMIAQGAMKVATSGAGAEGYSDETATKIGFGDVYMLHIPESRRQMIIPGVSGDAYVLIGVRDSNFNQGFVELSFVVSTSVGMNFADANGMINFGGLPVSSKDEMFMDGAGGSGGGSANNFSGPVFNGAGVAFSSARHFMVATGSVFPTQDLTGVNVLQVFTEQKGIFQHGMNPVEYSVMVYGVTSGTGPVSGASREEARSRKGMLLTSDATKIPFNFGPNQNPQTDGILIAGASFMPNDSYIVEIVAPNGLADSTLVVLPAGGFQGGPGQGGTGGTTSPMMMPSGFLQMAFGVSAIKPMPSSAIGVEFTRPVTSEIQPMAFKPASVAELRSLTVSGVTTTAVQNLFDAGRFVILKNLNFKEVINLMSIEFDQHGLDWANSFAHFLAILPQDKIVDTNSNFSGLQTTYCGSEFHPTSRVCISGLASALNANPNLSDGASYTFVFSPRTLASNGDMLGDNFLSMSSIPKPITPYVASMGTPGSMGRFAYSTSMEGLFDMQDPMGGVVAPNTPYYSVSSITTSVLNLPPMASQALIGQKFTGNGGMPMMVASDFMPVYETSMTSIPGTTMTTLEEINVMLSNPAKGFLDFMEVRYMDHGFPLSVPSVDLKLNVGPQPQAFVTPAFISAEAYLNVSSALQTLGSSMIQLGDSVQYSYTSTMNCGPQNMVCAFMKRGIVSNLAHFPSVKLSTSASNSIVLTDVIMVKTTEEVYELDAQGMRKGHSNISDEIFAVAAGVGFFFSVESSERIEMSTQGMEMRKNEQDVEVLNAFRANYPAPQGQNPPPPFIWNGHLLNP